MTDQAYVEGIEDLSSAILRNRYRTLVQLGAGGMALVHLAVARAAAGAEKLVVLKSIRPDLVEDARVLTMFADEARLAVRLNHPNVVQTYDVIKVDELPIIVMEYLEGQSFSACISAGIPLPMRLRVVHETLSGLEYAHGLKGLDGAPLGVVHRDMSPQNVIITYDGQVKLLDFGIAKAMGQTTHTAAGEIKGKVRYMAPEQMIGRKETDRRADVFSVGVMLWEAITNRRLWDGVSDVEVIQTVLESGVPAPRTVAPDVDPDLERVCMKAVAENLDVRYSSALAMQEDLSAIMTARGYQATARDLATWVQTRFAGRKARMLSLIRAQMEQEHAKVVEIVREPGTTGLSAMELSSRGSRTKPVSLQTTSTRLSGVSARWIALAGLGVAAVAGLSFAVGTAGRREAQRTDSTPPVVSSLVSSVVSASSTPSAPTPVGETARLPADSPFKIGVNITATPKGARLYWDGEEIPNPFSGTRPADGAKHTVRAEARGYVSKSTEITVGPDPVQLTVSLDPQRASGAIRRPGPSPTPPTAPAAPSAGSPSGARCDTPFYRDSDGILHARPGCIQ